MAKHKYKNKSKNNNNSPAVAPKAKFSTSENDSENLNTEINKAEIVKKNVVKKADEQPKKASDKKNKSAKKVNVSNKGLLIFEKFKENKKLLLISAAALVLIIAIVILLVVLLGGRVPDLAISEYNGQNATVSVVSDISVDEETQLERYNEIKRQIKGNKSKFKFYCRPTIEIDEKYKEGTFMFSNLTMNDYTMIVTVMDEEGDVIFRSMGIAPGKCMQRITLTKSLTFGEHEVTMYVTAYDRTTYEVVGTQRMKLELIYGDEYSASEEAEFSTSETTANPSITRPVQATSATARTVRATTTTVPGTQSIDPNGESTNTLLDNSTSVQSQNSGSTTLAAATQ